MNSRYDAVVIGAGHNGLTAAFYSPRAGLRTLVLERREVVSGCCVTEEIDGTRRLVAAFHGCVHGQHVAPEIIRLQLDRHGLRMVAAEPTVRP